MCTGQGYQGRGDGQVTDRQHQRLRERIGPIVDLPRRNERLEELIAPGLSANANGATRPNGETSDRAPGAAPSAAD